MSTHVLTRRNLLTGGAALTGLVLLGCSSEGRTKPAALPKMVMYKDPDCGCCGKWGEAAQKAGFAVSVVHVDDLMALKTKHKIPDALISCHTTVVDGYVVEGHVPLDAVRKLLRTRPKLHGIAVAGMPVGSPGMEVPGRPAQKFDVIGFDAAGKTVKFA